MVFMKKILTFLVVLVITTSVCIPAFAEDISSVTEASSAIEQNQSMPQDLQDKIDTLKALNGEAASMRQELADARISALELRMNLKEKYSDRRSQDWQNLKTLQDKYKEEVTALNKSLKELNQQLLQALKDKDKAKVSEIRDQIKDLKQTIEDKKTQFADIREKIQQEKDLFQQVKADRAALKEELKPYNDQAAEVRDELQSQRDTMVGYRQQLKAAVEIQDYAAAGTVADSMISLQDEINSDMKKLIDIKNAIKGLLQEKSNENQSVIET
jgi:chromosome segregation ATPase